jgi:probable F420-dependent oxidoreductase
MRIGIHTAQIGPLATAAAVKAAALAAEEIGYSSVWVLDRLPAAIEPRNGYADIEGLALPEEQRRVLDPFAVLATCAALTERVRIGVSVLVAPWYAPALLARMLTSLDVLSDGRLSVGLGVGWSIDEFEAVGVERRQLARKLEEALDVLDAHWSDGPIEYEGSSFRIAPAYNELRPVQQPRPQVLLAGFTPAGLDRVARRADGWNPAQLPPEAIAAMWAQVRDLAAGYGRDPDSMELVVRANIMLTDAPIEGARMPFSGNAEQVADDIEATRRVGAHEVILGIGGVRTLDQALDGYARIAEAADVRAAASDPVGAVSFAR